MPPHPFEYHRRAVAARGLGQLFAQGSRFRLVETRANGQPALAVYRIDPHAGILRADGLLVITLAGPRVSALTMFAPAVLARFGLPGRCPRDNRLSTPPRFAPRPAGRATGRVMASGCRLSPGGRGWPAAARHRTGADTGGTRTVRRRDFVLRRAVGGKQRGWLSRFSLAAIPAGSNIVLRCAGKPGRRCS